MDWATQQTILYHAPFSAVVDIDGAFNPKTGRFWQVDKAIDAGHKSIFIREGTYAGFTADVAELVIMGENWDVIIDGETTSHAVAVTATNVHILRLSAQTTGGGGQVYRPFDATTTNTHFEEVQAIDSDNIAIAFQSGAAEGIVSRSRVIAADSAGIWIDGPRCRVIGNYVESGVAADKINVANDGDNFCIVGNHCEGTILIDGGGDNGLCVANVTDGAVTDGGAGNTVANNEQY